MTSKRLESHFTNKFDIKPNDRGEAYETICKIVLNKYFKNIKSARKNNKINSFLMSKILTKSLKSDINSKQRKTDILSLVADIVIYSKYYISDAFCYRFINNNLQQYLSKNAKDINEDIDIFEEKSFHDLLVLIQNKYNFDYNGCVSDLLGLYKKDKFKIIISNEIFMDFMENIKTRLSIKEEEILQQLEPWNQLSSDEEQKAISEQSNGELQVCNFIMNSFYLCEFDHICKSDNKTFHKNVSLLNSQAIIPYKEENEGNVNLIIECTNSLELLYKKFGRYSFINSYLNLIKEIVKNYLPEEEEAVGRLLIDQYGFGINDKLVYFLCINSYASEFNHLFIDTTSTSFKLSTNKAKHCLNFFKRVEEKEGTYKIPFYITFISDCSLSKLDDIVNIKFILV
jgi:hypothetical protein